MTTATKMAKQTVHDKLESQIKAAEAKLDLLKAHAEVAKANLEVQGIAELQPKKQLIQQKLNELKNSTGDRWKQAKADLEAAIAELEDSAKEIAARAKAN